MLAIRQDGAMPGQWLMDRDAQELEQAAAGILSEPRVSFYQWEVPTLSLGYHQTEDKIDYDRLRILNVPMVRY